MVEYKTSPSHSYTPYDNQHSLTCITIATFTILTLELPLPATTRVISLHGDLIHESIALELWATRLMILCLDQDHTYFKVYTCLPCSDRILHWKSLRAEPNDHIICWRMFAFLTLMQPFVSGTKFLRNNHLIVPWMRASTYRAKY